MLFEKLKLSQSNLVKESIFDKLISFNTILIKLGINKIFTSKFVKFMAKSTVLLYNFLSILSVLMNMVFIKFLNSSFFSMNLFFIMNSYLLGKYKSFNSILQFPKIIVIK